MMSAISLRHEQRNGLWAGNMKVVAGGAAANDNEWREVA